MLARSQISKRMEVVETDRLESVEGTGAGENGAATKLQKVYRSYRTRRKLADSAVVVEELWYGTLFHRLPSCLPACQRVIYLVSSPCLRPGSIGMGKQDCPPFTSSYLKENK